MTTGYINGKFLPLTEIHVSAMDRGFLFGDGVYEVIPVYNGRPFRLQQHLARLDKSLAAIELTIENSDFISVIEQLIQRNGGGNQSIYLQCTRGSSLTRDHAFPSHIHPTIFAYSVPLLSKSIGELSHGITAVTLEDIRWQRCDIKAVTLLANILARQYALKHNAQEAILINNGFALEGSAMNLFIVKDNIIITPPISTHILGGVTRDLVLELAIKNNHMVREKDIPQVDLFHADEIWLTSSNREIVPVIKLDNKGVGNGQAGVMWHKLIRYYQEFKHYFGQENS